jgi:hypothetical protein
MLFVGGNGSPTRRSDRSAAEERDRHRRTAADGAKSIAKNGAQAFPHASSAEFRSSVPRRYRRPRQGTRHRLQRPKKKPGSRPRKKQRTPDDEGQSEAHAHDGPHGAFGRGRVLTCAPRARLNYSRRHDHRKPHQDDFGTQKRRRLLGDENEARRGDGRLVRSTPRPPGPEATNKRECAKG